MAKKQVAAVVKIQIPAGQARLRRPSAPRSVRTVSRSWTSARTTTEDRDKRGQIVPVEITIYEDRSFSFILKTPPTPFLIRQAAGLETAANNPGREVAGTITKAQVEEIANTKMPDLNAIDLEGAMLQVEGTARSMGIKVV